MITTAFSSSNTNTRLLQQQLQHAIAVSDRDTSQLCGVINCVNALISSCAAINLHKVCLNVFWLN